MREHLDLIIEKENGASVSEIVGKYLGKKMAVVMRVFSVILLIMCGVVFTKGPAALLGVVVCPISSGDTAYRSARLTIADWFKIDQSKRKNRILITILLLGTGLVISNLDYSIVWRYFSFSNQTLATIVLWSEAVYLSNGKKNYLIALIPAVFMTAVTTTYFLIAEECLKWLGLSYEAGVRSGIGIAICVLASFMLYRTNKRGLLTSLKSRFHK